MVSGRTFRQTNLNLKLFRFAIYQTNKLLNSLNKQHNEGHHVIPADASYSVLQCTRPLYTCRSIGYSEAMNTLHVIFEVSYSHFFSGRAERCQNMKNYNLQTKFPNTYGPHKVDKAAAVRRGHCHVTRDDREIYCSGEVQLVQSHGE